MAGKIEKHGRLEIDEHYPQHVHAWRFKRVGWAVIAIVIGAALCGFLGPGAFSDTVTQGPGGLSVKYQRVARYNAPASLELSVPGGKDDLELSIPTALIREIDLERIDPDPKEMRLSGAQHT